MSDDSLDTRSPPSLWTGQALHFVSLVVLLIVLSALWSTLGRPFPTFFWTAAMVPIVHQLFVWVAWRLELRSSLISNQIGFNGYLAFFFMLFCGRFVTLIVLAWLDRDTLNLHPNVQVFLATALAIPGLYAVYSVKRYFGLARAAGGDHFEARYRDMPLVNEGIFRFTNNGMYGFAFLVFSAIAVGFGSSAALVIAVFSHAYIWVHFYATEKPDMDFIYGPQ